MADWLDIRISAHGSHQTLPRAAGLRVRLPENPTTGFRWVLLTSGTLRPVADSFSPGAMGIDTGVGAAGWRQFELAPITVGLQRVELVLRQAWDAGAVPLERLAFTVEVV